MNFHGRSPLAILRALALLFFEGPCSIRTNPDRRAVQYSGQKPVAPFRGTVRPAFYGVLARAACDGFLLVPFLDSSLCRKAKTMGFS